MKRTPTKVTRTEQVNLVDIVLYLLSNWIWYVLCILLCLSVAYYRYSKTTFRYKSSITAILKSPNTDARTVRLDNYESMINTMTMSNEELVLRSVSLMSEVVKELDADVYYYEVIKLRAVEWYKALSPVQVRFSREQDDPGLFDLNIVPLKENKIQIDAGDGHRIVALGDTVSLNQGKVVFVPTERYDQFINHDIRIQRVPVASAAGRFLGGLGISYDQKVSNIITLTMDDINAQRAADILNILVQKYNEDAVKEKNRIAVNTAAFIQERIRIIEKELGGVESDIINFKTDNQLMDVDEAASRYLAQTREYQANLVALETQMALARYLQEYINNTAAQYVMIPANTGLEDANIDAVVAQYNDLVLRREKLVQASSTESPAVKQTEMSMTTLRHNILGLISNRMTSLEMSRRDLQQREQEATAQFAAMPVKEQQWLDIQRQQSIKESLYTFLLNKREENILTQSMADDNIRVVDPAYPSYTPSFPNRMKMILLAILIGILIPSVVLIARLFLDTKIRTRKEIEENVDVPFLAEIPMDKKARQMFFNYSNRHQDGDRPSPFVYDATARSIFTEAMRMMCTSLNFLDPDSRPPMVVTMTSYAPSSGKTFITANMAACLADSKKKVVVVDADLRKRSFSDVLGLKHKTKGLSNFLHDLDLTLDDVLHKDVKPGIDFIPAGTPPPNPGELLGRERFDEIIKLLRERYEYIILDSVPVQMLADPIIMNRAVDANIFILRSGQLDRRLLPHIDELYDRHQLRNMAIVFTGSQIRRRSGYGYGSYGYGYGYAYGYGYGYGYGEEEENGGKKSKINPFNWFKKKKA